MAFDTFDKDKKGCISTNIVGTILDMMGQAVPAEELSALIMEIDTWGKYWCIKKSIKKESRILRVIPLRDNDIL